MNKNELTAALKKKALGAAIAVAVSTPAFADVTLFGIVDVGIGTDSSDNDVLSVDGGEARTIELPSIWGIKGSEDLGGGLTASFALESDLDASTGGTDRGGSTLSNNGARFWARQANISLSNDMGSLTLGRIYSPALLAIAGVDPRSFYESQSGLLQYALIAQPVDPVANAAFALLSDPDGDPTTDDTLLDATGSTTNTNMHADVFLGNAIQVKFTPGPLNIGIAYGAGEQGGDTGANSNMHIGVTYSTEELTVMANYVENKGNDTVNDSVGENKKSAVGAKYTMGDIKLAGYYIKGEANGSDGTQAVDNEGISLGATFTSGSNEFDIAYYQTKNENANVTDNETDDIIIAYRNNLSDRTTLYAKLCNSDRGAGAPAGACVGIPGENETFYGFGVFHKF
jgi:predicted porin